MMAERPVPKPRSLYTGANDEHSVANLFASSQPVAGDSKRDLQQGLPSCLTLKRDSGSQEKHQLHPSLPQLLFRLNEAFAAGGSEVDKANLANSCIRAASSPIGKYRILRFFDLLENNKHQINKLDSALSILEKYALNLLRNDRPPQWRVINYNISVINDKVFPVVGALDILKQMGYTEDIGEGLRFPLEVNSPNLETIVILCADLKIARHEIHLLRRHTHPFLVLSSQTASGDTEKPLRQIENVAHVENEYCGVCSEPNVEIYCKECDMKFCRECDQRWHSHKLRQNHRRIPLIVSGDNSGNQRQKPIPVPRQRKIQKADRIYEEVEQSVGISDMDIKRPPAVMTSQRAPETFTPTNNFNASQKPLTLYGDQAGNFTGYGIHSGRSSHNYERQNGNQKTSDEEESNRILTRVFSCPYCSVLVDESNERCPTCDAFLHFEERSNARRDGQQVWTPEQSNPNQQKQQRLQYSNNSNQSSRAGGFYPGESTFMKDDPQDSSSRAYMTRDVDSSYVQINDNLYEEVNDVLTWSCEHCTFVNPVTTKICQLCYKTPSDLSKFPNLAQKSAQSNSKQSTQGISARRYQGTQQPNMSAAAKDLRHVGNEPPPLPPRQMTQSMYSPKIIDAVKQREQQLSEKEKAKIFDLEKQKFFSERMITKDETYTIQSSEELNTIVKERKRMKELYELRGGENYSGREHYSGGENYPGREHYPGGELYSGKQSYRSHVADYDPNLLKEHYYGGPFHPGVLNISQGFSKPGVGSDQDQLTQLLKSGVINQNDVTNHEKAQRELEQRKKSQQVEPVLEIRRSDEANEDEIGLTDDELKQMLETGVFHDENNQLPFENHSSSQPWLSPSSNLNQQTNFLLGQGNLDSPTNQDDLNALYQAGVISLNYMQTYAGGINYRKPLEPRHNIDVQSGGRGMYSSPPHEPPPPPTADIQQMFKEFALLQSDEENPVLKEKEEKSAYHIFNVACQTPVAHDFYNKRSLFSSKDPSHSGKKENFSTVLNSKIPFEDLAKENYIDSQSKVYVEWIKEAEQLGFTPEELNLANNINWRDTKGRSPVQWLKDEWPALIAEVVGKVTQQTRNENDYIGNLSVDEAKEGLLENSGSVESACKSCIESRREKLVKMSELSSFCRTDCLHALDRNHGNLDKALFELQARAMEPFVNRVSSRQNTSVCVLYDIVQDKDTSVERRTRIVLTEFRMRSWGRAETAVRLVDMGYGVEDSVEAAKAFGDLPRSLKYLAQECQICFDTFPMREILPSLSCQDKICRSCLKNYFTITIKEKQIHQLTCPVCDEPDLSNEMVAAEYFNQLDILLRELVDEETHDLFQKKLRDKTLMKDENFRWCSYCSCGFINDVPMINKMQCPHCLKFTCFGCGKPWEDQHDGITCEQFARWKEENDEEYQMEGLAGYLARNGIECPNCKFRYDLARGGCMHFKCAQCGHEFCSGCNNPFKHGGNCDVSPECANRGIHAHHPRDCLFFLRDWEAVRLEELLEGNQVDFRAEMRRLPMPGDDENVEAVIKCKVMLQTNEGMEDVACGLNCEPGHNGLCLKHYKEYLVDLINKNGVDPAEKMTHDEIAIVFRRNYVEVPEMRQNEEEEEYTARLLQVVKQKLPLAQRPGLAAAVVDIQEVEE